MPGFLVIKHFLIILLSLKDYHYNLKQHQKYESTFGRLTAFILLTLQNAKIYSEKLISYLYKPVKNISKKNICTYIILSYLVCFGFTDGFT